MKGSLKVKVNCGCEIVVSTSHEYRYTSDFLHTVSIRSSNCMFKIIHNYPCFFRVLGYANTDRCPMNSDAISELYHIVPV